MSFSCPEEYTEGPAITKLPDYSGHRALTVFCWSRTEEQTPRWEEAERLGRLAAEEGYSIVTGGYCGSMEAVSKGARLVIEEKRQQQQNRGNTPRGDWRGGVRVISGPRHQRKPLFNEDD
ncbi:ribosomal protein L32-like protein [Angomonas deanei]|uniref:SLOG cluster4 family, putative n=1 Tax=Angomonas deanei TaxID=59799 RepID=A0A7G2CBH1_9TRYP|nr:ribosomal protein L32-like protein [Angomonas deanei]CAD2216859.1 SLOG cluster4 family, putative [Angomonas deanei]|eukprot:EPY39013.1 ribosomal protein L32-like protein [Angomonas deanei]